MARPQHQQILPEHGLDSARFAAATRLAEIGRQCYARGWTLGTSGNFSSVITDEPLRLVITRSGLDKGVLSPEQFVQIDESGRVVEGSGRPSDEAQLHLSVVRLLGARAVLHTHSVWSTVLSELRAGEGGVGIEGLEMLKGLEGVRSHQHREWLPIVPNSQDMTALARGLETALTRHPDAHGLLIRCHGLYTWGRDVSAAKRHLEVLEFLLEVAGRTASVGVTAGPGRIHFADRRAAGG